LSAVDKCWCIAVVLSTVLLVHHMAVSVFSNTVNIKVLYSR